MENEKEKIINDRLNGLEKRQNKTEDKIEELDDKIDLNSNKSDERYIELVKATADLKGSSKATEENTKRTAIALEGLVDEIKQSNKRTDSRFDLVNNDISDIKSKINSKERDETIKLEERKLSNGVLIALISGGAVIVPVLINVIAPLLF